MELGSYFLFLQEQIKDIIIISAVGTANQVRMRARSVAACLKDQQRRAWKRSGLRLTLNATV